MFYDLYQIHATNPLFSALERCQGVEQDPKHHPEGDVFVHSVQVLNLALRESKDVDLVFAAMLHDVGKRIESKGHEKYSVQLVQKHTSEKTQWLILNHMRFWYYILGDMKRKKKVEEISTHKWLPELTLLARWDQKGRVPGKPVRYDRLEIIHKLREMQ